MEMESPKAQRQEVTLLFASIRGFAGMTEKIAPATLIRSLNTYLARWRAVVIAADGQITRYLNESVIAVFGAPLPDHAIRACNAGIAMAREFRQLQPEWVEAGLAPLDIDIGITTGSVVTGKIAVGGTDAANVVGEAVSIGRHIESLNREYGTHILLGERAYRQVANTLPHLREIDLAQIRNRPEPVRVYEVMLSEDYPHMDWLAEFSRAYELFRANLRPQARAVFKTLAEQIGDPVSRHYLDRCSAPRRRRGD